MKERNPFEDVFLCKKERKKPSLLDILQVAEKDSHQITSLSQSCAVWNGHRYLYSGFWKTCFPTEIFSHLHIWIMGYLEDFLHLPHLLTVEGCPSSFTTLQVCGIWENQRSLFQDLNPLSAWNRSSATKPRSATAWEKLRSKPFNEKDKKGPTNLMHMYFPAFLLCRWSSFQSVPVFSDRFQFGWNRSCFCTDWRNWYGIMRQKERTYGSDVSIKPLIATRTDLFFYSLPSVHLVAPFLP